MLAVAHPKGGAVNDEAEPFLEAGDPLGVRRRARGAIRGSGAKLGTRPKEIPQESTEGFLRDVLGGRLWPAQGVTSVDQPSLCQSKSQTGQVRGERLAVAVCGSHVVPHVVEIQQGLRVFRTHIAVG
jgi:hypothetical protein